MLKDLINFKLLSNKVRNNIIYFIIIININFNKLKAYVIVVIKLTGKFNTLLAILK